MTDFTLVSNNRKFEVAQNALTTHLFAFFCAPGRPGAEGSTRRGAALRGQRNLFFFCKICISFGKKCTCQLRCAIDMCQLHMSTYFQETSQTFTFNVIFAATFTDLDNIFSDCHRCSREQMSCALVWNFENHPESHGTPASQSRPKTLKTCQR